MLDHLRETADVTRIYSVPASFVQVATFENAMAAVPGARRKINTAEQVFFRIVTAKHLTWQKGTSSSSFHHLDIHDIAIALHSSVRLGDQQPGISIYTEPVADIQEPDNPCAVLSIPVVAHKDLAEHFLSWETAGPYGEQSM